MYKLSGEVEIEEKSIRSVKFIMHTAILYILPIQMFIIYIIFFYFLSFSFLHEKVSL